MGNYASILEQTKQFVFSQMAQNDAAHDADHILRVVQTVRSLCASYPQADAFRAELLAWLHDMNDDKLSSNMGKGEISSFLRGLSVAQEDVRFIEDALPYISYRKHPKLSSDVPLEIRIVQDADRIDAMGAVGIARTFAYGGAKNRSLGDSLRHFDEKLLLLYDLLNTEQAKRLALPRHQFLQAFYEQYKKETQINGGITLEKQKKKMIAPIVVTVLMVLYYIAYFGLLISLLDGFWKYALGIIPLAFSGVTIYVCIQRINEIKKGEEDDISQY